MSNVFQWLDDEYLPELLDDYYRLHHAVGLMAKLGMNLNIELPVIIEELEFQELNYHNVKQVAEDYNIDEKEILVMWTPCTEDINLDHLYIQLKRAEEQEDYELCCEIKEKIDAYKENQARSEKKIKGVKRNSRKKEIRMKSSIILKHGETYEQTTFNVTRFALCVKQKGN